MKRKEVVFPCLSCGADTGCANKLLCDHCRASGPRANRAPSSRDKAKGKPRRVLSADLQSS